jgi:hypothetical protein
MTLPLTERLARPLAGFFLLGVAANPAVGERFCRAGATSQKCHIKCHTPPEIQENLDFLVGFPLTIKAQPGAGRRDGKVRGVKLRR